MSWIALKHLLISHLPLAAGLLLPWALFASQRPGRGIRPWWTVCRYVGWMGLMGLLGSIMTGWTSGRLLGFIPPHRWLPLSPTAGGDALFFRHTLLAGVSLAVGLLAIWAMNRRRKDHQSLGFLALLFGLAWSVLLLMTGENGYRLTQHVHARTAAATVASPPPASHRVSSRVEVDPELKAPFRALDHAALESIHAEPVKSREHGGRWIRAWVSPEAASDYRAGRPLPQGALVVLSTLEDRFGRPGLEAGPLYALEMKAEGPALTFYWPRVPMERRREFGGDSRLYWRGQEAQLESCRACHETGMADPAKRSRWRIPRLQGQPKPTDLTPTPKPPESPALPG